MQYWIDAVGYGIPASIRLTKQRIYKGSHLYKIWYGVHSTHTTLWNKLKLIWKNGKRH